MPKVRESGGAWGWQRISSGAQNMPVRCARAHSPSRDFVPCLLVTTSDVPSAEPCNLRGDCQTNNTCFCTNGYKTCRANDGTITGASAGCETDIYEDDNNCGDCFNVSPNTLVLSAVCI